jgi:ubiquinone/menaquinone biosynthesis C-methylase UbiE
VATIFREWSHRYRWFHSGVSWLTTLSVGGKGKFRRLALEGLEITSDMHVLDLCCGDGQTTRLLVARSANVVGLDASQAAIEQAMQNAPAAKYVQGWAEAMPFGNERFDLVHASVALHEMRPVQLWRVLQEVHRILKPGGTFTFVDFHAPFNWLHILRLDLYLFLFENDTAWQFIKTDLIDLLARVGFQSSDQHLRASGSLQVVQAYKGEL